MEEESIIVKTPDQWLSEIKEAMSGFGNVGSCDHPLLCSFAKEAPKIAAFKNGIDDADIIEEMENYAWENLDTDLRLGCDIEEDFEIVFALVYLDGLVGGRLISERDKDEIMESIASEL